ncbi:protein SCARECROW-like [Mercurialis annua]|uniref:protein SCARECROW-like n=1 Tax=Mercurialis annua TaxID=3986 RepID=UPI002160C9C5|nr:protein SCARECROW-like [Mercurialis annua]
MMIKGGYEVVNGAIDLIQTHEAWDYHSTNINSSIGMNLERNEQLSDWVEHVTKQLIDDLPDTASDQTMQTDSTMVISTSHDRDYNNIFSTSDDFRPRKALKRSHVHNFDGTISNGYEELSFELLGNQASINRGLSRVDEQGLNLIVHLLECAVSISVDNLGEAHKMLLELTPMASPYAPSCAERVVAYFSKAMASRVINSWLGISNPLLINHKNIHSSFQIFNNVSPFIKFAHFTSNQAILEAFHRRDRVHIIDLDIMQGLQWPALFHILATRIEGPPHIRMTGFGSSMELLVETGKQLSNFAKRLGLLFEFNPIAKKFGEISDISMLKLRKNNETLAVHWLQHSLYDSTGPDWKTMRLLEELSPRIITLVEQEISHGGSFLDRFVGSLHYYSTLFDSLGAFLPSDDSNRHRIEHCLFYREINNILAIGGPARSGEDKFRQWRGELGAKNNSFMQIPMSGNSMAQAQLILNMFPPAHGYSLVQGDGALKLGWKDTSLFTASSWTSLASR